MNTIDLIFHLRGFHPDVRAVAAGAATAVAGRFDRETLDRWHAESPHACHHQRSTAEVVETRAS